MSHSQRIARQLQQLHPQLPMAPAAALDLSESLLQQIDALIRQEGPLPFSRYMQLALYAPGLGYYSAGLAKFGAAGDFVTAPEISPLFSQTLARQCAAMPPELRDCVLEIGAGRGVMAAAMLQQWERDDSLPQQYYILEVSADLQQVQRATLQQQVPHLLPRVQWLQTWPQNFCGLILANEVLDALPVTLFRYRAGVLTERAVTLENGELAWTDIAPSTALQQWFAALPAELVQGWGDDYISEAPLLQHEWLAALAAAIQSGLVLLTDYGFARREYYLPERAQGTLMCHYRHHAHEHPLLLTGLQDLTAHVDFTAVAESALSAGMQLAAYSHQAAFLQSGGILQLMMEQGAGQSEAELWTQAQAVKRLLLPSEMGELFKLIALRKNTEACFPAFAQCDMRWRL